MFQQLNIFDSIYEWAFIGPFNNWIAEVKLRVRRHRNLLFAFENQSVAPAIYFRSTSGGVVDWCYEITFYAYFLELVWTRMKLNHQHKSKCHNILAELSDDFDGKIDANRIDGNLRVRLLTLHRLFAKIWCITFM